MEDSTYSDLLPALGKIADGYYLSGAERHHIPCLPLYIRFVQSLEKFLLVTWNSETAQNNPQADNDELRLTRAKHETRDKKGVIRNYQAFRQALKNYTQNQTGFHKDNWKSYISLILSRSSLFCDQETPPPLFKYIIFLISPHPEELINSFLSMSEDVEFADVDLTVSYHSLENDYTKVFDQFFKHGDIDALWQVLRKLQKINTGGELIRYKAFEPIWSKDEQRLLDLKGIHPDRIQAVKPIYGIEDNYQQLQDNLTLFIQEKPYRHVLLWGYRGTGKSSCVIKLANEFFNRGIRLVDYPVSKIDQIHHFFELLENYREKFILFLDDLSFEKDDTNYKTLKSRLEGSVKQRSSNIILHATSNRRELADPGQSFMDERSDYPQILDEKRAIDDRFGLKLFFDIPVFDELKKLLMTIAKEYSISVNADELFKDFRQYCMFNRLTSPGGRAIRQFLDQLTSPK